MKQKGEKEKTNIIKIFVSLATILVFLFGINIQFKNVFADNQDSDNKNSNENSNSNDNDSKDSERYSNIDEAINQKQQDLNTLESKIQTYQKILDIKKSQQNTLNNQIEIIDNQIDELGTELESLEKKIDLSDLELQQLDLQIQEKTQMIQDKQSALKVFLNNLYRNDKRSLVEVLLTYPRISVFVQEAAYEEQANQKVFNKLQEIDSLKKDLESKQSLQKEKRDEMESLHEKKLERKFYLTGEQDSRQQLLEETQGEESRYQELLNRVEAQKQELLGDLDDLSASKSSELGSAISNQSKPTSGLSSIDWYFSQRDPRWGSSNIGYSNTKMSKYGCAVTAVSMVFRYNGINIDPGILARQPVFSNDLIVWPDQWQYLKRVSNYSHGNIDWKVIDSELANHNPVIVFVRANGRGAGHYVVVHHKAENGKYVVHDPYWGPNIYLDSTRENISVLYGSGTSVDQMIIYHNTKRDGGDLNQSYDTPSTSSNSNSNSNSKNSNSNSNKNKNKNTNSKQGMTQQEQDKLMQQMDNKSN